jgi:hypothetical protein
MLGKIVTDEAVFGERYQISPPRDTMKDLESFRTDLIDMGFYQKGIAKKGLAYEIHQRFFFKDPCLPIAQV